MGTGSRHELVAYNTATSSTNKIHDDAVARRYGFGGGLVPGVDVYAYMTRPAAAAWGLDWLRGGALRARFLTPVYDGRRVAVVASAITDGDAGLTMAIEVRDEGDTVCATGEASLPAGAGAGAGSDGSDGDGSDGDAGPPPAARWAGAPEPPASPPEASPASLAPGTKLAGRPHRFAAAEAAGYLADVREDLPLYAEHGVAHPGWLLRGANHVLGVNVRLGPWIHVESHVRHHDLVRDGESVQPRAVVTREWEHKGHRFVELDVGLVTGDGRVAARIAHTAIYRPRPPDPDRA